MAAGLQSTVWTVWSWLTEMMVFLVIPLVTLVFNICVVREVRRISLGTPLFGSLSSSLHSRSPACSAADNHQLTPAPENSNSFTRNTLQLPQSSGRNHQQTRLNHLAHLNEKSPRKSSKTRSPGLLGIGGGSSFSGPSSAATTLTEVN